MWPFPKTAKQRVTLCRALLPDGYSTKTKPGPDISSSVCGERPFLRPSELDLGAARIQLCQGLRPGARRDVPGLRTRWPFPKHAMLHSASVRSHLWEQQCMASFCGTTAPLPSPTNQVNHAAGPQARLAKTNRTTQR